MALFSGLGVSDPDMHLFPIAGTMNHAAISAKRRYGRPASGAAATTRSLLLGPLSCCYLLLASRNRH